MAQPWIQPRALLIHPSPPPRLNRPAVPPFDGRGDRSFVSIRSASCSPQRPVIRIRVGLRIAFWLRRRGSRRVSFVRRLVGDEGACLRTDRRGPLATCAPIASRGRGASIAFGFGAGRNSGRARSCVRVACDRCCRRVSRTTACVSYGELGLRLGRRRRRRSVRDGRVPRSAVVLRSWSAALVAAGAPLNARPRAGGVLPGLLNTPPPLNCPRLFPSPRLVAVAGHGGLRFVGLRRRSLTAFGPHRFARSVGVRIGPDPDRPPLGNQLLSYLFPRSRSRLGSCGFAPGWLRSPPRGVKGFAPVARRPP